MSQEKNNSSHHEPRYFGTGFENRANYYPAKTKSSVFEARKINNVLFFLIVVFGIFYIYSINILTVDGFHLQELKDKVDSLAEQNKEMELEVSSLESNGNLRDQAKNLDMIAMGSNIEYIVIKNEIARR